MRGAVGADLTYCRGITALPERLGGCAALATLGLTSSCSLTALPERLGDCAALKTLDLIDCESLPSHLAVAEKLAARSCEVRR